MSTIEIGTLDGVDIHALRNGELDAVAGGGGPPGDPGCGPCCKTGYNASAMCAWDDLSKQLFGRTF